MGANYSPLLADLFLFHCEFNFMEKLTKTSVDSYSFRYITRYIDDVNFPEFDKYLSAIYFKDLEITKSAEPQSIHYLDLNIKIGHPIQYLYNF